MGSESERLAALRATGLLDTPPEADFDELTLLASRVCGGTLAAIVLVDEARLFFKSRVGTTIAELPREGSFCARAIEQPEPLVVRDALLDARFACGPMVTSGLRVRFYAGFRLSVDEGPAFGVLCVMDPAPRELDDEQRASLCAIARQVSRLVAARRQSAELARTLLSLGESEARFRTAFEAGAGGLAFVSLDGHYLRVNRAFADMLGFTEAELTGGMSVWDVTLADDLAATEERFRRVVEDPTRLSMAFQRRFVRKDGTVVWAQASSRLLRDARGAPSSYISQFQDISALKEVDRLKDEFVSTAAHELRTPLTAISGALGLLDAGVMGALPPEAQEVVTIARSSCDRLVRLVNDLLEIQKMEAGMLELKVSDALPGDLVATAIEGLRAVAEHAGVTLARDVQTSVAVSVDVDRIVQVLTNLVSNAIKFSPRGGEVMVRVLRTPGGEVRFAVHDQGPGIAQDKLRKLFSRFSQLDSSDGRARTGTGLGLAICKAIVEEHDGDIGVESRMNEGSMFFFDLAVAGETGVPAGQVIAALDELRAEYGGTLPARAAELARALERVRAASGDDPVLLLEATTHAHRLGGTAGSYGFDAVGEHATRIERELPRTRVGGPAERDAAWRAIDAAMSALVEVARPAGASPRG